MIYLLTVNYYSTPLIAQLIQSLPSHKKIAHQLVVVNNSREDTELYQLSCDSLYIIESQENLGFAYACNLGLNWIYEQDSQAIIWIINPDTSLLNNSLEKVPEFLAAHPQLSILGTIIYTPDQKIWFGGGRFIPRLGSIFTTDLISHCSEKSLVSCDWVSGCSLVLNLHHFSHCPQFDPAYFLYYEDFDFCRRQAEQGHQIGITKHLAVIHQPSSITDRNQIQKYKHCTYSYLLTLERYTSTSILVLRLVRLTFHALILLCFKPHATLGKLFGIFRYLGRILEQTKMKWI